MLACSMEIRRSSEILVKNIFAADLCVIVDEEQGAADQLVGGEEGRADATILDQLQTVQVHVLKI